MSEIDRLSHEGLYPALPIADKRESGGGADQQPRNHAGPIAAKVETEHPRESASGKEQKTTIDEYA